MINLILYLSIGAALLIWATIAYAGSKLKSGNTKEAGSILITLSVSMIIFIIIWLCIWKLWIWLNIPVVN